MLRYLDPKHGDVEVRDPVEVRTAVMDLIQKAYQIYENVGDEGLVELNPEVQISSPDQIEDEKNYFGLFPMAGG